MASKNQNNHHIFKIMGAFIIGIVIGALFYGFILVPKVKAPTVQDSNSAGTNIINLSATGDPKLDLYFKSQITAPSYYYVTDDQMLEDYNSQGGMAPPRLVLTKNYQLIPKSESEPYLKPYLNYNKNDCISIWSTGSFTSIDDWSNLFTTTTQPNEVSVWEKSEIPETIKVGDKSADLYKVKRENGNVYAAFLPVTTDLGGVSYFFMTCNENNKQDLENIIKSIKFKKALSFSFINY